MSRRGRRIRRWKSASVASQRRSTPIIHHQSSLINFNGFTLIELLVVISIVALLMAILLPTLQRVRRQAKAMGCQTHLRQAGLYFATYAAEYNGRFDPDLKDRTGAQQVLFAAFFPLFAERSLPHKDMLRCPMASQPKGMLDLAKAEAESSESVGMIGDKFHAWSVAYRRPQGGWDSYLGSYGFNLSVRNFGGSGWGGRVRGGTTDVRAAPNIPVFMDCPYGEIVPTNPDDKPAPYEGFFHGDHMYSSLCPVVINRHDGTVNGLFLDWSVRKVGLKEIWTLKWLREWNTAGPWTRAGGVQSEDWPEWMRGFKDY